MEVVVEGAGAKKIKQDFWCLRVDGDGTTRNNLDGLK